MKSSTSSHTTHYSLVISRFLFAHSYVLYQYPNFDQYTSTCCLYDVSYGKLHLCKILYITIREFSRVLRSIQCGINARIGGMKELYLGKPSESMDRVDIVTFSNFLRCSSWQRVCPTTTFFSLRIGPRKTPRAIRRKCFPNHVYV
jgi:hypothetical protein